MRYRLIFIACMLAVVLGLAGCSDPAIDRLTVGDQVILSGGQPMQSGNYIINMKPNISNDNLGWGFVHPGTLCRVAEDPGGYSSREVRIIILEGRYKDESGTISRYSLRKVPGR